MNYSGLETLRADVSALSDSMYDLRSAIIRLEALYGGEAASLSERLVSRALRRNNAQFPEAWREILTLDEAFQD